MDENGAEWKALAGRLVSDEPVTWSREGLDDKCFFCGASSQAIFKPTFRRFAVHEPDCSWVEAMRALGRDLGLHQVASHPDPDRMGDA